MESFFARVEHRAHPWPAGRADLHIHVLPPRAVAEQLVEAYRPIAHDVPGLAAVPAEWLHLTVLHSAPRIMLSAAEVAAIVERLTAICADVVPFETVLGRPHVGNVAIECAGYPGAPARALWRASAQVISEVTDQDIPRIPASYHPHLSLAYAYDQVDHAPLRVALSDLPGEPVVVPATELALVWQQHDGRHITWEPITTLALGGRPV